MGFSVPQERRARNREEVIHAILDTACAVMRDDGVAALNLHEVARRLGMRAQSLYTYFPSTKLSPFLYLLQVLPASLACGVIDL
jgi:AcrR family transcriptional regulator